MPALAKNKKQINLLVREGFEYTTAGKALHWLLTVGRTIVVLTELIVIVAFISRFWLDRTLTDLSDQNNVKKTQIEANAAFEADFRNYQQRLKIYKALNIAQVDAASIVKTISSILPAEVSLTDLNLSEKTKLSLKGISINEAGVAGFINSLTNTKKFKNIVLSDVTLDTRGAQVVKFSIKADLVSEKGAPQ